MGEEKGGEGVFAARFVDSVLWEQHALRLELRQPDCDCSGEPHLGGDEKSFVDCGTGHLARLLPPGIFIAMSRR